MSEGTHEPTTVEQMEISVAAAEAAKESASKEEAQGKMETAMTEKARELRVTLDPEASKTVAREVIAQLDSMGAFRREESHTDESTETVDNSSAGTEKPGDAVQEPPQKKNWIQRLVSDD